MKKHIERPEERLAQKTLAKEFITDLHGNESYAHAKELSEVLFSGDFSKLNAKDIEQVFKGTPVHETDSNIELIDLLVNASISSSKREAREFINNGAITINGETIKDEHYIVDKNKAIEEKYLIVRRGKKKYTLIILI